jgi:ribonuclease HI
LEFKVINNVVEYETLLLLIELANNIGIKLLEVFGDSELIILQVKGVYSTKDERLKLYREAMIDLIENFEAFYIKYILRSQNDLVDASSSQTLEVATPREITTNVLYRPSIPNSFEHW